MSGRRGPWQLLGIDAKDSDERAVKRAYAQKLKAINVDADPAGFIALRKAMERALDELRGDDRPEAEDWDDEGGTEDRPLPAMEIETAAEVPVVRTVKQAVIAAEPSPPHAPDPLAALNDELRLLSRLLFGEHEDDKLAWQIELCWQQIIANPALDRIDILADVEQWFAGAITQSLPRSDPLVWPAIKFFNWSDDRRRWNDDGRVTAILHRQHDLSFLHQLAQPDNLLHYAFKLLHQFPAEVASAKLDQANNGVRILLRSIRYHFPNAEWNFDEAKVQAWIEHLEAPPTGFLARFGSGGGKPVFDNGLVFDGKNLTGGESTELANTVADTSPTPPIVWLGLAVMPYVACWWTLRKGYSPWARLAAFGWAGIMFFFLISVDQPPTNSKPEQTVDDRSITHERINPDFGIFITPAADRSPANFEPEQTANDLLTTLERVNPDFGIIRANTPKLYAKLRAAAEERARGNLDDGAMAERINHAINLTYQRALPNADQSMLAARFRLIQERLGYLQHVDPAACIDESRSVDATSLPESHQQRLQEFIIQVVIGSGRTKPDGPPIDMAAMIKKAARSAGIVPEQFLQRLSDKRDARSACGAKLALLKAIGDEPEASIAAYVRSSLSKDNAGPSP